MSAMLLANHLPLTVAARDGAALDASADRSLQTQIPELAVRSPAFSILANSSTPALNQKGDLQKRGLNTCYTLRTLRSLRKASA